MRIKSNERSATAPILDRTMARQGFGGFSRSAKSADGREVFLHYPSGAIYRLPLEYALTCCAIYEGEEPRPISYRRTRLRVLRTRTFSDGHSVRLYLTDGSECDIAWDTVLMACEPRYEHYGGLTQESRLVVKRWSKFGPFRVS
jgi:hypothetical protein